MTELTQSYGEYRVISGDQTVTAGGDADGEYQTIVLNSVDSDALQVTDGSALADDFSQYVQFQTSLSVSSSSGATGGQTSRVVHALPIRLASTQQLQPTTWANTNNFQHQQF